MRKASKTQEEAGHWWSYLKDQDGEVRQWCARYERVALSIVEEAGAVVQMLRVHDFAKAERKLDACRRILDDLDPLLSPSISAMVELAYRTALAYFEYRKGLGDAARESLDLSVRAIERAIEASPFLVPCAGRCYELQLHRARISRNERDWDRMWSEVELGRSMVQGRAPLCRGPARGVFIEDICRFYELATPLNDLERETLERLSDPAYLQREYEAHCLAATIVPFIIFDTHS